MIYRRECWRSFELTLEITTRNKSDKKIKTNS